MNKNTSKAFRLSAIVALIVVEGGVAHASWQESAIQPTPPSISVPAATVQTLRQGGPTYSEQYQSGRTTNATKVFEWVEDGNSLIPYQTRVRLHATAVWPHPVTVDPATPGIDLDHATALLMMSDPDQQYSRIFRAGVLEYSWFYDSQQRKVVPFREPDLSLLFCEKDVYFKREKINGVQRVFLSASFNLDTTAKAEIMTGTTTDEDTGQEVNTFAAKVTSGASTITPGSFEIVPGSSF